MTKNFGISLNVIVSKPKTPAQIAKEEEAKIAKIERRAQLEFDAGVVAYYQGKLSSCKDRKIPFLLTLMECHALLASKTCHYSGLTFEKKGTGCLTLERINPELGYTPENTVAVRSGANHQKSGLDAFVKGSEIPDEMKIKLLRKATYQLEKKLKSAK